jgi:hypothetical protein
VTAVTTVEFRVEEVSMRRLASKRVLLAGSALVLVAVAAAGACGVHLRRRLDTPEFQKALLDQVRATVGADVRVREMDVSFLSGVTLEGLAVANPAPFPGNLLTADAFVLRYRLLPLLAGRVEVEKLALEKPALSLAMDARGVFNYERLGGARGAAAAPAGAVAVPLRIVLKQLSVEDATIAVTDHTRARLLRVEGAAFRSAFEIEGGVARGSGQATIATVDVADLLFVRGVRSPLALSKETVKLAPARGRIAGGQVTGDVTVSLEGGFRYVANLDVKGASVETLLAEAKSPGGLAGTLDGKATFEGSGGLPTLRGRGRGTIGGCRAENARSLALVAGLLQVKELANPDFEECRFEFTQAGARLSTPVVILKGDAVRLAGHGTVNLATSGLDYEMTLALSPKLFAKVTRPELRPAFKPAADGFSVIGFRLYGTTREPQTDLVSRLGKAAATEAAKNEINRLLKKKIF